jgi:hypothetical protein
MPNSGSPTLLPLEQLHKDLGHVDVLICSASYETRCLSVPQALDPKAVGAVYVLRNEDVLGNGISHATSIANLFQVKANEVVISKSNPVITADKIIDCISGLMFGDEGRLLVDITAFTHETLLVLFKIISETVSDQIDVRYVYTGAKDYDPGTTPNQKWLSRGVSDICSVLGYPGEMRPSRKSHLIVLVGFEDERAGKLIEMYEPAVLSLGVGKVGPVSEHLFNVNETYYKKLIEMRSGAENFSFSPTDAYAVRDTVLEQVQKIGDYNVIVAPMNTKISTLGVALAAFENPNIQICYARANSYNVDNYSEPRDDCRVFSLT